MYLYLEIIEELEEEETFIRQPQMIRIEIKSEDEAPKLLETLEPLFCGRKYTKRIHYCYHDENKPCEVKILE